MKTASLWVIRVALTVQFIGVLSVPALLAATESPRAMWMAEWFRPQHTSERTIGILKLRDGKLMFNETSGQAEWAIDLSSIKRVANANGRALSVETFDGGSYLLAIMDPNLTIGSPKKVLVMVDQAMRTMTDSALQTMTAKR